MTRICARCGTEFERPRLVSGKYSCRRTCGDACAAIHTRRSGPQFGSRVPCTEVGCRKQGHLHACLIPDCPYPRYSLNGLCRGHFKAFKRTGDPNTKRAYVLSDGVCSVPGCSDRHRRNGLCQNHSGKRERILKSTVRFPTLPRISVAPLLEVVRDRHRFMTVVQIAESFGVEKRTVCRWMAGETKTLRRADAEDICDRIGIHPASLWDDWIICKHGSTECSECKIGVAA